MIIQTGIRTDIPAFYSEYNTRGHLCRYCYANYDAATVKRNMLMHNPNSPLLLGELLPSDKIHEAEQKKWADLQLSFDW